MKTSGPFVCSGFVSVFGGHTCGPKPKVPCTVVDSSAIEHWSDSIKHLDTGESFWQPIVKAERGKR